MRHPQLLHFHEQFQSLVKEKKTIKQWNRKTTAVSNLLCVFDAGAGLKFCQSLEMSSVNTAQLVCFIFIGQPQS